LGVEIKPGIALTPLPSSIGRGSNPQPSDREPRIYRGAAGIKITGLEVVLPRVSEPERIIT